MMRPKGPGAVSVIRDDNLLPRFILNLSKGLVYGRAWKGLSALKFCIFDCPFNVLTVVIRVSSCHRLIAVRRKLLTAQVFIYILTWNYLEIPLKIS